MHHRLWYRSDLCINSFFLTVTAFSRLGLHSVPLKLILLDLTFSSILLSLISSSKPKSPLLFSVHFIQFAARNRCLEFAVKVREVKRTDENTFVNVFT